MSFFQEYDSVPSPSEKMEAWFWPCLVVSAFLLCAVLFLVRNNTLTSAQLEESLIAQDQLPPPVKIETIELDPALFEGEVLQGTNEPPSKPVPDATKIDVPADQQAFEKEMQEVHASPAAPEMTDLAESKPRELASSLSDAISNMETQTQRLLEEDLNSMNAQLINDKPSIKSRTLPQELPGYSTAKADRVGPASSLKSALEGESAGPRVGPPGFSDLDELLSKAGPMNRPTAQIMMPADLLFEYDQFALSGAAIPSLQKLGLLIKRNPTTTISIEGHTDSFGNAEYNQELSEKRALAVKLYLTQYENVDPRRITTYGFGTRKLLVSGDGSIEQQQINRRVEIVIRQKNP